jgi:ubiquinone/menaquinone biosynthesis C-methylase UbiE
MELLMIKNLFPNAHQLDTNLFVLQQETEFSNQNQTNDAFSEKWTKYKDSTEKEKLYQLQKEWYLTLYGFTDESNLAAFLRTKKYIFDAGCGLGFKTQWFAELAPESIVVGMDFSESVKIAAASYKNTKNLFFVKGDIANTQIPKGMIDYVNCDQVIMHTENPEKTFAELTRLLNKKGEFACYVYAQKALPRELLDDFFRIKCKDMDATALWEMSEQLTELGKRLSELQVSFECPDIPALGIKGGTYDVQRFLYWNFLKCFWNESLGYETSKVTNFDWYSPSNAKRYSKSEFKKLIADHHLTEIHFHQEEACFSGRFRREN